MWELDYKESWVPKNWCFWTAVLQKTLECPLDLKEIKPVNPKGNQSWIFKNWCWSCNSNTLATCCEEQTHWKRPLGKIEDKRKKERRRMRLHHWLNGHEFEQALGFGDGQGSLACCSPWGHKSWTRQHDWTELSLRKLLGNYHICYFHICLRLLKTLLKKKDVISFFLCCSFIYFLWIHLGSVFFCQNSNSPLLHTCSLVFIYSENVIILPLRKTYLLV